MAVEFRIDDNTPLKLLLAISNPVSASLLTQRLKREGSAVVGPNPNDATLQFLSTEDRCLHCLQSESLNKGLTYEHIFPSFAGSLDLKMTKGSDPLLFSELVTQDFNIIRLCRQPCHDKIDNGPNGKTRVYRTEGVVGLVDFVARYPRTNKEKAPDLYERQYYQWMTMFRAINDKIPDSLDELYEDLLLEQINLPEDDEELIKCVEHQRRLIQKHRAYQVVGEKVENYLYLWSKKGDFEVEALIA